MSNVNDIGVPSYQTPPYQALQYNQERAAEVDENLGTIIYDELAVVNNENHRDTYFPPISEQPE